MMANMIDIEDKIIKNQSEVVLKRTADAPKEEIKWSNEEDYESKLGERQRSPWVVCSFLKSQQPMQMEHSKCCPFLENHVCPSAPSLPHITIQEPLFL